MSLTIIAYSEGLVDPADLERIGEKIEGDFAYLPVWGKPAEAIQVITDADGLRIVEVEKEAVPA